MSNEPSSVNALRVRRVQTSEEAEAVFRLRYAVYVEELGRRQLHADHAARTIEEPIDRASHIWAAYFGDALVGTVRSSYAARSDLGVYPALYDMGRVGAAFPTRTSVTTKLFVVSGRRQMSIAQSLACATFRQGYSDGIEHDFIDVYPSRRAFFERLGYRVHVPHAVHPEYGEVIVMRLDLHDHAHLARVGSPLVESLFGSRATGT